VNAEFSQTPHKRGTLSMARAQDPNSAGSQFFICVADANFLDGQYTAFGEVANGMEIVDRIVNVQRDGNDNPLQRIEMTLNVIDANA
jgi:peptidyl-prolyl cis-trans isomerase B (cyclophilin B)